MMPGAADARSRRHAAVRRLLATEQIHDQTALLRRLRSYGFPVTQSSVSRDLQELRAAKVDGRYLTAEALAGGPPPAGELAAEGAALLSVRAAGPNLLVLQTPPGHAAALALAIDRAGWPESVGTVAGDDTVFLATTGRQQQARLEARLAGIAREQAR